MFEKQTKRGKVIVGLAVAYVNPTGLSIAAATMDAILQVFDEKAARNPDLNALAKEMDTAFHAALKGPAFDTPKDARTLLPQMLEQTATRMDFAKAGLDAGNVLAAMTAGIDGLDYRPEYITAFERLMRPVLQQLCDDPRLKAAIDPALTREMLQRQAHTNAKIDTQGAKLSEIQNMIESVLSDGLSAEELRKLAVRFGASAQTSKQELVQHMNKKAEELHALEKELSQLRRDFPSLDNVIAEALRLLDESRDNTDAVRKVIRDARQTLHHGKLQNALEENAKLAEIEARALLFDGEVEQAATILTAGADALAVVDALEPARRKGWAYFKILYEHGLRYGGRGLVCAIAMGEAALHVLTRADHPLDWARTQQNLAVALEILASRTIGETGTALLTRAIGAYEAALEIRTRADHPLDWAMTQQNLAGALATLASRTDGEAGAALLTRAIGAYEDALQITTRADHPLDWAMTQQNLGNALEALASRTEGEAGTALLNRAIDAYEGALQVRTREDHPLDWAQTQQNLGNALATLASRTAGKAGTALLTRAIGAYEDALQVRTREDHPAQWAMTQENLAILHARWAEHDTCTDPHGQLQWALAHVDAALTVYDPEHMSFDHRHATDLRDRLTAALAALDGN